MLLQMNIHVQYNNHLLMLLWQVKHISDEIHQIYISIKVNKCFWKVLLRSIDYSLKLYQAVIVVHTSTNPTKIIFSKWYFLKRWYVWTFPQCLLLQNLCCATRASTKTLRLPCSHQFRLHWFWQNITRNKNFP